MPQRTAGALLPTVHVILVIALHAGLGSPVLLQGLW